MLKKASNWLVAIGGLAVICFLLGILVGRLINPPLLPESPTGYATEAAKTRLNINTATAEELETLPGIGQTMAQRIIAYRDQHGPFATIAELQLVEGIGQKTVMNLLDLTCTED